MVSLETIANQNPTIRKFVGDPRELPTTYAPVVHAPELGRWSWTRDGNVAVRATALKSTPTGVSWHSPASAPLHSPVRFVPAPIVAPPTWGANGVAPAFVYP